jgi:hypothetical protein
MPPPITNTLLGASVTLSPPTEARIDWCLRTSDLKAEYNTFSGYPDILYHAIETKEKHTLTIPSLERIAVLPTKIVEYLKKKER